jgi:predicted RNA binding protein YcfA (HicA-like mRNA interferase family)
VLGGLAQEEKGEEGLMSGLHNLKPDRVVKAFERAGWQIERKTGSHFILSKEGYPYILSVPVHKGRPIKQGLIKSLIKVAGLTADEFLRLYR